MTLLEQAREVRELLSVRARWTKGADARDGNGEATGAINKTAVCWCLDGAIEKVTYENKVGAHSADYFRLRHAFNIDVPREHGIFGFNDRPETDHKVLLNQLDKTVSRLEANQ